MDFFQSTAKVLQPAQLFLHGMKNFHNLLLLQTAIRVKTQQQIHIPLHNRKRSAQIVGKCRIQSPLVLCLLPEVLLIGDELQPHIIQAPAELSHFVRTLVPAGISHIVSVCHNINGNLQLISVIQYGYKRDRQNRVQQNTTIL